MFKTRDKSESRVIFKKNRHHRNGYVHDDYIAEENEDGYSDDDDVFVEDSTLEISSATKPLMHPRQRTRVKSKHPDCKFKLICKPVLYFVIFVSVLGGLMSAILYTVNKHKHSQEVTSSGDEKLTVKSNSDDIVGCDQIEVEDVWDVGIPKLLTESAFRMVDLNKDGVLDVVMGFGTGADGYDIPEVVCDIYFQGQKPCRGGVIALEGKTGQVLWKQFSKHELYALNCNVDLNEDGVFDCLAAGRAGAFEAISGKNGDALWRYDKLNTDLMNFYTPQYIYDIDGDKIPDILQIHGGDPLQEPGSKYRLSGKIMLFSGKTGRVIKTLGVPDHKESYYSPQIYTQKDGTQIVLFGTGGETHGGSLWRITLHHLIKGQIHKAKRIYTDNFKGVMTPPVLLDLNKDDVEDIVISMFNSSILAIDGRTFHLIWNYTFINSETYCSPAPGYYNEDEVPDFLVKYQTGPGFPIYYSSETTVLDGKTGQPLISPGIKDSIGAQSSPLTISVQGRGNDIFLFWMADCLEHVGQGGKYGFIKGTNVHEQSRSDNCRFRFKTKGFTELLAKSRHVKSRGVRVYYSEDRLNVEHSEWINTTQEAIEFVQNHPEHIKDYDYYTNRARKMEVENVENTRKNGGKDDNDNNYQRQDIANRNPMTSSSGKKGGLGPRPRPRQRQRQQNRQKTNQRPTNRGRNQGRYRGDVPGYPYDKQSPFSSYYSNGEEDPEYQRENRKEGRYFDPYDPRYEKKRSQQHKTRPLAMAKRSNDSVDDSFKKTNRYILESVKNSGRIKRHVGPHDGEGIQRLISTGTVAPTTLPVDHPDYNQTAEIIFATYWFFPAKTQAILESDQKCIADLMSKEEIRMQPNSKYYGMDHDAYEQAIVKECLHKSGSDQLNNDGRIYESQTSYNPYDVHMGQMTVYRIRLKCSCSEVEKLKKGNKRCSRVLPFEEQEWPSYMGRGGDSHWRSRTGL